jgi:geranylgeranyl diphosphate synthase type II
MRGLDMSYIQQLHHQIKDGLEHVFNQFFQGRALQTHPSQCVQSSIQELVQAHHYPLAAGGKRVRPLLTLLMAGSVGGDRAVNTALSAACATELIHTYSLVHDDLPCMDNDDLRRGKPTTHKVYGDAKALLVGDGLLTHAFTLLSQTNLSAEKSFLMSHLVAALSCSAGAQGMVLGQWLDISFTGQKELNWQDIETVHYYKTGCMLGVSLELGLLCGLAHTPLDQKIMDNINSIRSKINYAGVLIGIAFQIKDDILDVTQTAEELGKTPGKDEKMQKTTAVELLGMENAQEKSQIYTKEALAIIDSVLEDLNLNKNCTEKNYRDFQADLKLQIEELLYRQY